MKISYNKKEYNISSNKNSVASIIKKIHPEIYNDILGYLVNKKLVDKNYIIENNDQIQSITLEDKLGIKIIQNSCMNLLSQTIKRNYPKAKIANKCLKNNDFYCDFYFDEKFTLFDLKKIEKKMIELSNKKKYINNKYVIKNEIIDYFSSIKETYIVHILKNKNIKYVTTYNQDDFIDISSMPNIPHTKYVKYFKLIEISGIYWMNDSNNKMLTRIHGICTKNEKELLENLNNIKQYKKYNHKEIGKQLKLFHFHKSSPGNAFWHYKGNIIWRIIEEYMRTSNIKYKYQEIKTPIMSEISMWDKSGHTDKYYDNMFITKCENKKYVIRPMNCPTCIQIYKNNLYSYKDLPIKMNEFGIVHRNETSGSLNGLFRSRSFTQDDAHIFCENKKIKKEIINIIKQCYDVYNDFGFKNFNIKLALRPIKRIGSDKIWDKAENILIESLNDCKIKFEYLKGEGAFYGPKIEFHLKDSLNRSWQSGTIQIDLSMPKLFNMNYIDNKNNKVIPAMIHRAIIGSLERFIGIIIEHYSGNLPLWLSPIQIVILSINDKENEYIKEINKLLIKNNIRSQIDIRNKRIGFKIRENYLLKIPIIGIVGEKERATNTINIKKGIKFGLNITINKLIELMLYQISEKQ